MYVIPKPRIRLLSYLLQAVHFLSFILIQTSNRSCCRKFLLFFQSARLSLFFADDSLAVLSFAGRHFSLDQRIVTWYCSSVLAELS